MAKKGFDIDEFLGSPLGGMGYKTGMGLLGDIFSSRQKRKQLKLAQEEAEKDLRDAYGAMQEDMAISYGTSGLADTYGTGLSASYMKGLERTRESYAKARKNSKSWLGSIFFG